MRRVFVIFAWIGLLLMVYISAYGQKAAAMVGPVSHHVADGGDRIEIPLSGGASPHIFTIEGDKPRLVLDFAECGYAGSSSLAVPGGVAVQGIRVGFHTAPKQKVRVVIDLAKEPKIKWTRDFLTDRNVLVISVFPAVSGSRPAQASGSEPSPAPVPEPKLADKPATDDTPVRLPDSTPVQLGAGVSKVKMASRPDPEPTKESVAAEEEPAAAASVVKQAVQEEVPVPDAPAAPASSPEPATAPVLVSVAFDNAFSQSGEMVLLQFSDFQPPVISTREKDPPRIFCDFAGAEVGEGVADEFAAGGKYVDKIRVIEEGSNVRVILDLIPGSDYDLQQVYFQQDNLFVLIVNAPEDKS